MLKQFNLSEWLVNPCRKVVTRDGRPVRILCTDAKAKDGCCIIAAIETDGEEEGYQFHKDGRAYSSKSCIEDCADIFFADDEEELTEFENELSELVDDIRDGYYIDSNFDSWKKKLLDLARKEIEKSIEDGAIEFAKSYMEDVNPSFEKVQESEELWKWKMSCLRGINKAYTKGREDALKDLPKWKKGTPSSVSTVYVIRKGYYLPIEEVDNLFETLPKEE